MNNRKILQTGDTLTIEEFLNCLKFTYYELFPNKGLIMDEEYYNQFPNQTKVLIEYYKDFTNKAEILGAEFKNKN